MKISFENGRFYAQCIFAETSRLRAAGFISSDRFGLYTRNAGNAKKLYEWCDLIARDEIDRQCIIVNAAPPPSVIPLPAGRKLKPWQTEPIHFAWARNRSYLSIDAGLGKQIIAAGLINLRRLPTIYICPAFLVQNVIEELTDWCPRMNTDRIEENEFCDVGVVSDSMLINESTIRDITNFIDLHALYGRQMQLIVDEAHRFKEGKAKRSKAVYNLANKCNFVTFMSGTDAPNGRPKELWAPVTNLAPDCIGFMNYFQYAKRYCDAKKKHFGWDFNGESNLEELTKRLKPFRYRLRKSDVATGLPDRIEEICVLDADLPPALVTFDSQCLSAVKKTGEFKLPKELDDAAYATYRKALGIAKVRPALKAIKGFMADNPDESFIVFAHHIEVIKLLVSGLYDLNPYFITSETKQDDRLEVVKQFQKDAKSRLFIVNIKAGGIGLTATKASQVIFVESSPTPADNSQAIDRAHRIGQTRTVYARYLVFKNSFERRHLKTLIKKNEMGARL